MNNNSKQTLEEYKDEIEAVSRAIINKKLVIFIGAGVSMNVGMKSWNAFLNDLLSKIEKSKNKYAITTGRENEVMYNSIKKALEDKDFETAAQKIKEIMDSRDNNDDIGTIRSTFYKKISKIFKTPERRVKRSPVYQLIKKLSDLGADKFITTNYDKNIETVTSLKGFKPFEDFLQDRPINEDKLYDIRKGNSFVFKLHGEDIPVLAKEEYDKIYSDEDNFRPLFKDIFNNNVILFIGCSLEKDRTLAVFKECKFREAFAIYASPKVEDDWSEIQDRLNDFRIHPIKLINTEKKENYIVYKEQIPVVLNKIAERVKHYYKEEHNPLIKDIFEFDFDSAYKFFNAATKSRRCIFFNVQIDFDKWFEPNFQLHLNLQKAALRSNKLKYITSCYKSDAASTHIKACQTNIPNHTQARIIFLPYTTAELNGKFNKDNDNSILNNDEIFISNFKILTYIHSLISCPLGIVTLDILAEIICNNKQFFKVKRNLKYLGLSEDISTHIKETGKSNKLDVLLKDILRDDIESQYSTAMFTPDDMDFAYLETDKGQPMIWEADILNNNILKYYKSSNLNKIKGYEDLYTDQKLLERTNTLIKFTHIISSFIFEEQNRYELGKKTHLIAKLNPQFKLYKDLTKKSKIRVSKEALMFADNINAFEMLQILEKKK